MAEIALQSSQNLDAIKQSIREKSLDDNLTQDELASLRKEIDCLSDTSKQELKTFFEIEFQKTKETARAQLDIFLKEMMVCIPSTSEKSPEIIKSSFHQVFEGTKSERFSAENIRNMQKGIDGLFPKEIFDTLTPEQQQNIRLAMTDRLLKDPKIQALFDIKIGVVDILGIFSKRGAPTNPEDTEKAKETPSIKETIDQAKMIEKTFAEQLQLAIQPLSQLLTEKTNKKETLPVELLANPKAIAEYNGGEIPTNITAMSSVDLKTYIASLNGEVRKIDAKILGMEQIKEWGMNFLANAPSFLVDFFKWLLSFDFIAKIFGYSGTKEDREATLDEELKQRRSLGILKEFGDIPDTSEWKAEGAKKSGESSGKIPMLRWVDLSGLRRDKLADFFIFTKEEGIDIETKEFWMGVFNDGKIMVKKEDGTTEEYAIQWGIKKGDFEKNFKGLYEKLNNIFVVTKKIKKEENLKKELLLQKPYNELLSWHVTENMQALAKDITLVDFLDNRTYQSKFQTQFNGQKQLRIGNDIEIIGYMHTLSELLLKIQKDGKMEDFKNKYLFNRETWEFDFSFKTLVSKRTEILAMCDYDATKFQSARMESAEWQKWLPEKGNPQNRKTVLVQAFENASQFPFQFGDESVNFKSGNLIIGKQKFTLQLSNGGPYNSPVSDITLSRTNINLTHLVWTEVLDKTQILAGMGDLLDMQMNTTKEITGKDGKLMITRVA